MVGGLYRAQDCNSELGRWVVSQEFPQIYLGLPRVAIYSGIYETSCGWPPGVYEQLALSMQRSPSGIQGAQDIIIGPPKKLAKLGNNWNGGVAQS